MIVRQHHQNRTRESLAIRYLAAIQAIAYGTRHIIETMNAHGHAIKRIHMCGGGTKNPIWLREHADITGCDIVLPREPEAVLLGSAVLAAAACGSYPSIADTLKNMTTTGRVIKPRPETREFHEKKYRVFLEMYDDQINYREIMR